MATIRILTRLVAMGKQRRSPPTAKSAGPLPEATRSMRPFRAGWAVQPKRNLPRLLWRQRLPPLERGMVVRSRTALLKGKSKNCRAMEKIRISFTISTTTDCLPRKTIDRAWSTGGSILNRRLHSPPKGCSSSFRKRWSKFNLSRRFSLRCSNLEEMRYIRAYSSPPKYTGLEQEASSMSENQSCAYLKFRIPVGLFSDQGWGRYFQGNSQGGCGCNAEFLISHCFRGNEKRVQK